jgi:peroxiredoxin Q/BCP
MAIDFKLHASNGTEVSLSDYLGRNVVLYFYPKDNTPGCTTESCDFRDFNGQFEQLNTVVLGISPDDLKSHDKFIKKFELPFLLLADTEQVVSNQFGVWALKKMYGKEYYGIERSTFLINAQGEIAKEWRKVKVAGHVQEVLEAVKGL